MSLFLYYLSDMQQQHKHKDKHVKWDQEKLKQTQKFRGCFEKIDEPKTPYRANVSSEQEQMQPENKSQEELALEQSLKIARRNSIEHKHKKVNVKELNARLKEDLEKYRLSGSCQEMEDEEQQEARKKHEQFKKKRAQHYKQYQMIQKMKNNQWQEDN